QKKKFDNPLSNKLPINVIDEYKKEPQSVMDIFKTTFEILKKKLEDREEIVCSLLSKLSFCNSSAIPQNFVLRLNSFDKSPLQRDTREILQILEQHSVIEWKRIEKSVYIHDLMQQYLRNSIF